MSSQEPFGALPPPPPPPPAAFGAPANRSRTPWVIAAAAIVVLLGGGTVAFALTRPHAPAVGSSGSSSQPTSTATPSPSGIAYNDPQGRYRATFAGQPAYHDTTAPSAEGNVPYMYAEYAGFAIDEVIGVLLLPAGSTYDVDKGLHGIADSAHGTVASSSPGSFQGHQSEEGVISLPGGTFFKLQVVRVGDIVYTFGTTGPVNPPADYDTFVASVQLTPH